MDPRNIPQTPFARPPSETSTRDPRSAPIPPPPYTLQAPIRQPLPTFNNDPFLPRRHDLDGSRHELHRPVSQSPFSLEKYAAGSPRDPPGSATVLAEGMLRDTNGSWSLGDRLMNGFQSHNTRGEHFLFVFAVISRTLRLSYIFSFHGQDTRSTMSSTLPMQFPNP